MGNVTAGEATAEAAAKFFVKNAITILFVGAEPAYARHINPKDLLRLVTGAKFMFALLVKINYDPTP